MRNISEKRAQSMVKAGRIRPSDATVSTRRHTELVNMMAGASTKVDEVSNKINGISESIDRAAFLISQDKREPDTVIVKSEEKSKVWNFEITRDEKGFIKLVRATEEGETF